MLAEAERQTPELVRREYVEVYRELRAAGYTAVGEFHYLEDLSKAKAYVFCYVATTSKIKGTVAGFALRPLAVR